MTSTRSAFRHRIAVAAVGAVLLSGVGAAGAASALDEQQGSTDVEVGVRITEIDQPGALALTVADTSTSLAEDGSTEAVRRFTGALPTVTVTDTRSADEVPDGAFWYVLGSITDFTGDASQPAISAADSFGWQPELVDGDPGSVSEGDPVAPGEGFTDAEILALAYDSAEINPEGSWSAGAGLTLETPDDVAPGAYSATLTLSLFE